MPHSIRRLVSDSNIKFAHQRDIFNPHYFTFINIVIEQSMTSVESALEVLPVALNFYFNIYFRSKKV